jgi:hypothetical protein
LKGKVQRRQLLKEIMMPLPFPKGYPPTHPKGKGIPFWKRDPLPLGKGRKGQESQTKEKGRERGPPKSHLGP